MLGFVSCVRLSLCKIRFVQGSKPLWLQRLAYSHGKCPQCIIAIFIDYDVSLLLRVKYDKSCKLKAAIIGMV